MLTQVSHERLESPHTLETLEQEVMAHVRHECPRVKWLQSFATIGPYDYVDIFEAPDLETATKVSTLVRTFGHGQAELWPATSWGKFKELIQGMPHATGEERPQPAAH
jgi:uncharacterized protein with GYD domain